MTDRVREGFTLLEVMVSLAIIAVALLTVIIIRDNSIQEAQQVREVTTAVRLAQLKMGELEAAAVDERAESGTFDGYPDIRWSKEVALEVLETSNTSATPGQKPMELYKVTLTTTYPKGGGEDKLVLVSYRLKKEDEEPKQQNTGGKTGTQGKGS